MREQEVRTDELDRFFREVAMCLGGILSTNRVPDSLVREVARSLEFLYRKARKRLVHGEDEVGAEPQDPEVEPHPAITHMLSRIGD